MRRAYISREKVKDQESRDKINDARRLGQCIVGEYILEDVTHQVYVTHANDYHLYKDKTLNNGVHHLIS